MNIEEIKSKKNIYYKYRLLTIITLIIFVITISWFGFYILMAFDPLLPHSANRDTLYILRSYARNNLLTNILFFFPMLAISMILLRILKLYRSKHKDIIDYWTLD